MFSSAFSRARAIYTHVSLRYRTLPTGKITPPAHPLHITRSHPSPHPLPRLQVGQRAKTLSRSPPVFVVVKRVRLVGVVPIALVDVDLGHGRVRIVLVGATHGRKVVG